MCWWHEGADCSTLGEPFSLTLHHALSLLAESLLQRHEFGEDIMSDSNRSKLRQIRIQVLLGNESWLRKQPRPLLECACLMHGIQEIKKNRQQLVNTLMSLTIVISNAKEAAAATTACMKSLRWLQRSTLAKLPWFILEGICSTCRLRPSTNSSEMVSQILQWVSPES